MQSVIYPGRTLVVSPHLDDAILSCGEFLSSSHSATVVTVLAGMPRDDHVLTDYDRQCGFLSADLAMRTRWLEDWSALSVVGAEVLHLDCKDSQYEPLPEVEAMTALLTDTLTDLRWDTVIMPMGLFHCDHERVSDACLNVARRALDHPSQQWILYEDVPYRRRLGVLQQRLVALSERGWLLAPVALEIGNDQTNDVDTADLKRRALACYASQLGTLGLLHGGDQQAPERFWSVMPDR